MGVGKDIFQISGMYRPIPNYNKIDVFYDKPSVRSFKVLFTI